LITFKGMLRQPDNYGNPGEFDYSSYLRSRGIYYSIYIPAGKWRIINSEFQEIKYVHQKIRYKLLTWIDSIKGDENAAAVLKAITLGSKDYLDDQLKQSWANAGGIHVMAVSGLHVGMIWAFLSYLLSFTGSGKFPGIFRIVIILLVLWFYALMTGMSASVVRSCLMFSLISAGKLFNRYSPVLNTVLLAAFIQILIDPENFHDAGFRFSYIAVLSIVIFHNLISGWFPAGNILLKKITDLISVSLAAQILTYPLVIYYFHRFPVYFLISNLILIPCVTVLMFIFLLSSIIFLILGRGEAFMILDIKIASFMNSVIMQIESLPGSVLYDLSINSFQTFILLVVPLILMIFKIYKKPFYFLSGFTLLGVFLFMGIVRHYKAMALEKFIVHNIRGVPLCSYSRGNSFYIFSNTLTMQEQEQIDYITENYRIDHFREKKYLIEKPFDDKKYKNDFQITAFPDSVNYLLTISGKRIIAIYDIGLFIEWEHTADLKADYLVLCDDRLPDKEQLTGMFQFDTLIISSSVKFFDNYKDKEKQDDYTIIDVRSSGACILIDTFYSYKKNPKGLGKF